MLFHRVIAGLAAFIRTHINIDVRSYFLYLLTSKRKKKNLIL
jgi:hypothetical protein